MDGYAAHLQQRAAELQRHLVFTGAGKRHSALYTHRQSFRVVDRPPGDVQICVVRPGQPDS